MPLLICEGRCNPTRPRLDDWINEFRSIDDRQRRNLGSGIATAPAPASLARELRTLAYTPHALCGLNGTSAMCTICYTIRRWGGSRVNLLTSEARREHA